MKTFVSTYVGLRLVFKVQELRFVKARNLRGFWAWVSTWTNRHRERQWRTPNPKPLARNKSYIGFCPICFPYVGLLLWWTSRNDSPAQSEKWTSLNRFGQLHATRIVPETLKWQNQNLGVACAPCCGNLVSMAREPQPQIWRGQQKHLADSICRPASAKLDGKPVELQSMKKQVIYDHQTHQHK